MPSLMYKQYFVIYEEKGGKIEIHKATANGNFICFDGRKLFDSIADLKNYIDEGHWDVGVYPKTKYNK